MAKNQISASRLADFRHWRWAQVRFTEYDQVLEPCLLKTARPVNLAAFRRICLGNRKIVLEMKF